MSNLRVKVNDTETTKLEGVSQKGKAYKIIKQENIFIELNEEIRKMAISLPEHTSPYPAGNYTLDPASLLKIGLYGLEVDKFKTIKLISVPAAGIPK